MFFVGGQPIEVKMKGAEPGSFRWRGRIHNVTYLSDYWRIHTNWWVDDGEIWRNYYEVTTDTKMLVELFWDRIKKEWRLERVYE